MLAALAASERAIEISGPGDAFDLDEEEANSVGSDGDRPKRALTSAWHPVTFNLYYELAQFVGFFQRMSEEISDEEEEEKAKGNEVVSFWFRKYFFPLYSPPLIGCDLLLLSLNSLWRVYSHGSFYLQAICI